jgi:hypothetical protein
VGSESSAGELVEIFTSGVGISSEDFKHLIIKKGPGRKNESKIWAAKGYDLQMKSFVSCLRQGKEPEITAIDGARAFLGCLLMLESAKSGGQPQIFDITRVLPD